MQVINMIMILCDNCKRGLPFLDDPKVFEREGWKATQVDGEWRDFCSEECEKEFKAETIRK